MANRGLPSHTRESIKRARILRAESSPPERVLWNRLRAGRFFGVKFERQQPIGPYIADFYCSAAALVIEVDGRARENRGAQDTARDSWMRKRVLRVLRIPAVEISRNLDNVLEWIAREVGIDLHEREE